MAAARSLAELEERKLGKPRLPRTAAAVQAMSMDELYAAIAYLEGTADTCPTCHRPRSG